MNDETVCPSTSSEQVDSPAVAESAGLKPEAQCLYHHLREAYRSLDRARRVAALHPAAWPQMEERLQQGMDLTSENLGRLEFFFLVNAKERRQPDSV